MTPDECNAMRDRAIAELIDREGGYVDHPDDPGGPTRYGITQAVARAYGYAGDMRKLPRSIAEEIYTDLYWKQPHFDHVAIIDDEIGFELFDTGVNMGTAWPGRFLQRSLNVLNLQGRAFPDLAPDGHIGKLTIAALSAYLKKRGSDGRLVLLRMLNAQQSVRYIELAEKNRKLETHVFGWHLKRVS